MQESYHWPVGILFGVEPIDNGNALDPDEKGTITYQQKRLKVAAPEVQTFMHSLCGAMRAEPWYLHIVGEKCLVDSVKEWMEVSCEDTSDDFTSWTSASLNKLFPKRKTCCSYAPTDFPYDEDVFDICLTAWTIAMTDAEFKEEKGTVVDPMVFFDKSGKLKSFLMWFKTNIEVSPLIHVCTNRVGALSDACCLLWLVLE